MAKATPRFLRDAVHTKIGHAHPLTGEQLTATKGLSDPVDFYKPNSRGFSFIDPEGSVDGLVMFQSLSADRKVARFAFQTTRNDVKKINWDFGDSNTIENGSAVQSHSFENIGTFAVKASVKFTDDSSKDYSVTYKIEAPSEGTEGVGNVSLDQEDLDQDYMDHLNQQDNAPMVAIIPSLSGFAKVGNTLSANPGVWDNEPSLEYQWLRSSQDIPHETADHYTLGPDDLGHTISVRVTATNAWGTMSETSMATVSVQAAD